MTDGPDADGPSPSEERLLELLLLLRAERPAAEDSLTESIMRTARWQYLLRGTLRMVGLLAGAVSESVALFLGERAGDRSDPR